MVIGATFVTVPAVATTTAPLPKPGQLDQSFGTSGQISLPGNVTATLDSVAVDSQGRILVAGVGAGSSLVVTRLLPTGAIDTGFATNGSYSWAGAAGSGGDPAGAIAVDSSDRIYVTGTAPDPSAPAPHPDVAVMRLLKDGTLDQNWNTSGIVTHDFGGSANDHGTSIAINGSHVYVGAWEGAGTVTDFAVLSFNTSDGTIDNSFGTQGVAIHDFNGGNDTVRDIAVMPATSNDPLAGDIVAVGYVGTGTGGQPGTPDDTGILMLKPDGTPDPAFNANGAPGTVQVNLASGGATSNDGARSVAVDGRGNIYVSGTADTSNGARGFVAAYKPDGTPISSFDSRAATGGVATLDYNSGLVSGNAGVTIDGQRHIVVVGASNGRAGIGRLVNARYAFDTTFASTGQEPLTCSNPVAGGADGVAVQSDSSIVVAGLCGSAVTVWRIGGGHEVDVPASPVVGGVTASAISANAGGRKITVGPGDSITLSLHLQQTPPSPVSNTEALVGFVNSGPVQCNDLGSLGFNGQFVDTTTPTLTAPPEPGIYYLALDTAAAAGCTAPATNNWTTAPAPMQAQYLAEIIVDGTTSISVASSPNSIGSSASATPLSQLDPGLISSTDALSALEASPLRSSPLRSSPLRSSGTTGAPLRSSPLRSSPLRSSPLRSSPLRSSPLPSISLADVPFTPSCSDSSVCPQTWADVLTGTPFAGVPLQSVTLQQLADYANSTPVAPQPPVPDVVKNLAWANIDLSRTAWRDVTLTAFLLGDTPLNALNTPSSTGGWGQFNNPPIDATNTTVLSDFVNHHALIDLELAGFDLSTYYHHDDVTIPAVSQLSDAPLTTLLVGSLNLANMTKIGAVPASSFGLPTASSCASGTTLAQIQHNDPRNTSGCGIPDSLQLGAVIAAIQNASGTVKISDVLPGLVSMSDLAFDAISTSALAAATPISGPFVTFTADFTYGCTSDGDISTTIKLPPGFRYNPNSASLTLDGIGYTPSAAASGAPTEFTTSVAADLAQVTFTATPPTLTDCTSRSGEAKLQAQPGITLGPAQASAVLNTSTAHVAGIDTSPVQVTDTQPPTSPTTTSTLFVGHLASPGQQDTYTLASVPSSDLPPGTIINATLSHIPTGADFDLSMFGPAQPSLRPLASSGNDVNGAPSGTGVPDTALNPGNDGTVALPEPQTDVPVSTPSGASSWGVSDNRGNVTDSIYAVVPDLTQQVAPTAVPVTLVVSGFNGSASPDPYTLLVTITLPANAPDCVTPVSPTTTARGTAPANIPAGTKTLILTDKKRMSDVYGANNVSSLFDTNTTNSPNSLYALAARPDVSGVVVPVEANNAVNSAYDYWDGHPCSPEAADGVVAAINKYVDQLRAGLTQLRYIVIAGDDQILPMARIQDHIAVENETTFANDETYKDSSGVLHDNQLSSALRDGYVLSDDAYGDVNPFAWLNGQAFVPDIAVGRLVEQPTDITNAIKSYISSNGVRTPNAAYTAGYDFNADGAQQVANTVAPRVPPGAAATSINSTWTKADAVNGMTTAAHGFISVNAHYDAYRALPAHEFTTNSTADLLKTTDLPSSLSNSILFTIGCHAGLSVADTFVNVATASPTDLARVNDWAQSTSNHGGLLAGNTGYGYGDDTAVAYSEKLMANFAAALNGTMTVGQALVSAKQSYLHLPLAAVDAKVMEQATFYGLPMYRVGTSGQEAPPSPLISAPSGPPTGTMSTFAPSSTVSRTFVNQPHSSGQGTYWTVQDAQGQQLPPLAVPGQPLQPQYVDSNTPGAPTGAASGAVPHGVLVTAQTTELVLGDLPGNLTNPVYSSNVPDGSSATREPGTIDSYFPATVAELTQRGSAYTALLNTGQFRASGQGGYGFQQLTDKMSYQLLYSDSNDFTPPTIKTVDASVAKGTDNNFHVKFIVTTNDTDANEVVVLYLDPASNDWQTFTVPKTGTGHFEGTDTGFNLSNGLVPQYLVQLVSNRGTVAESKSKGQDYTAQPGAVDNAPTITLSGALTGGQYAGPVVVSVGGGSGSYNVAVDSVATNYVGPFVVSAPGSHTVHVTDANNPGTVDRTFVIANVLRPGSDIPAVSSTSPKADGSSVFTVGQTITPNFTCSYQTFPTGSSAAITDPAKCFITPSTLDNSFGQHSAVITAIAPDGNRLAQTVSYNVQYAFAGFAQPVNDPSTATTKSTFKINSTIPVKFQLQMMNAAGTLVPIPDATATAIVNNCLAVLSYSKLQNQSAGAVDESVYTTAVDSGGCFRYDTTGHQFIYNLSSKELGAAPNDVYDIKARLSLQFHDVNIALK